MRRRTPAAPRLGAASTVALALLVVYAALTLHRASDRRRSTTVAKRTNAAGDARAAVSVSVAHAPADPAAGVTLPLGRAALGPRRADFVGGIVGDGRPAGAGDRPAAPAPAPTPSTKCAPPAIFAIVFPQYHAIPENDAVYGPGFVEWTLLKPVADVFEGYRTFRPHADIGYYNLLEHGHRKYMRVLANHYGVDGFIFYHYWFTTGPVLQRPTERMLLDGEPDKPFFFCWVRKGGGGERSKAGASTGSPSAPSAP